jgi:energy-converting hydrogenase Eha subunit B
MSEGLAAAWRNRRPLFVWAVVSAVVGVLLNALESADNPLADLASFLFSVAWSVLTYFVVPVIVFEDVDGRAMFERSGETFKRTWGETAGASFGVGIVTVLFTLVGLALAALVFFALGGTGVGVVVAILFGGLVLLTSYLLGSTLGSVAKTALYVYATEGNRPAPFENVDFENATR